MNERRETLCRLVQIPRQKVKTPPQKLPPENFQGGARCGRGCVFGGPPSYMGGGSAMHTDENRAARPKVYRLAAMQRRRKPERRASVVWEITLDLYVQASGIVGYDVVNGSLNFSLVFLIGQGIGSVSEAVETLTGEIVMLLIECPPRIELQKGIKGIVPSRKRTFCHIFTTFILRRGRSWKR